LNVVKIRSGHETTTLERRLSSAAALLFVAGCTSHGPSMNDVPQTGGAGNGSGSAGAAGLLAGGAGGASGGGGTGALAGNNAGGNAASQAGEGGMSPSPNHPWDLTGIIGTGQSLSVGAYGIPSLTTSSYPNLKLSLGTASVPPFDPQSAQLSLVQLVEPLRALGANANAYPNNLFGESPHTAMGSEISSLFENVTGGQYVTIHSAVGESGQAMSVIDKAAIATPTAGRAFAASLFETQAIARLAKAKNQSYGVGAIVLTHGETDANNWTYEADLAQLRADYNASLSALTGQTAAIPLLLTQQNSSTNTLGSRSPSALAQWRAGVDHPGEIVCVGPKYQYPYYEDGLHLVALGYDLLGEKYGQVYFERVIEGHDWQPLQPSSVEHSGRLVTVHFHVPVAPLVWDARLAEPHQSALRAWQHGHGFEVSDAAGSAIAIDDAQIVGDSVQLTCATDPGDSAVVRYAMTADGTPMTGGTARWGTLRDSDPFVGVTTKQGQPNYAVAFELPLSSATSSCAPPLLTHSDTACTRSCWTMSAADCAHLSPSSSDGPPKAAIDGDPATRYSSGVAQPGSSWLQVDLGAMSEVDGVKLDSASSTGDFAASYEILVSSDAKAWRSVACGTGSTVTDVGFAPQSARYVRILQRGAKGNWWSVHELNVFCTAGHDSCTSGGTPAGELASCDYLHPA